MDVSHRPKYLYNKYKIQNDVHFNTPEHLGQMIIHVMGNLILVIPLGTFAIAKCIKTLVGPLELQNLTTIDGFPGILSCIAQFVALVLISEFTFYGMHVLLHSRVLYTRVHKIHHRLTAPVAFAALYTHPLETVIGTIVPLGLGVVLLRTHLWIYCLWCVIATVSTCHDHSGYRLPFVPKFMIQPNSHDLHHKEFNVNYAFLGLADALFGTKKN